MKHRMTKQEIKERLADIVYYNSYYDFDLELDELRNMSFGELLDVIECVTGDTIKK